MLATGMIGVSIAGSVTACADPPGHTEAKRPPTSASRTKARTPTPAARPTRPTRSARPTRPARPTRSAPATLPTPASPFAKRRIVAFYGSGTVAQLGVLGHGTPAQAWSRLVAQAAAYARPGQPAPLPAFELIATMAQAGPGPDGQYREREPAAVIDRYLRTVRAHHGLLILDIQPGRSDFLTEARALAPWLRLPDVSLALDPEWRMGPGQRPGQEVGSVSAAEVNAVSGWLDRLVIENHLPPKLFLLHKFRATMLRDEPAIIKRPHLDEVVNMDGYGVRKYKLPKYHQWAAGPLPVGIKLFYRQDPDLLSPANVRALTPSPVIVDYQ